MHLERNFFVKNWQPLVFANVTTVTPIGQVKILKYKNNKEYEEITQEIYDNMTPEEREKTTISNYEGFRGTADSFLKKGMYCTTCCRSFPYSITFDHTTYRELDFLSEKPTFWFDEKLKAKPFGIPRVGRSFMQNGKMRGLKEDILCGIVDPINRKFISWFNCSHQFLNLWNLLVHKKQHPATMTKELYDYQSMFKSNKLNTNGFLRRENYYRKKLRDIETGPNFWAEEAFGTVDKILEDFENDAKKEFWITRQETIAREYSHVYLALAIFLLFNIKPTKNNIPQLKNAQQEIIYRNDDWNLPISLGKMF